MRSFIAIFLFLATAISAHALPPDSLWSRTFGGANDDRAFSVHRTSDGGYILAGYEASFGAGSSDMYLVRTDANGDSIWGRTYGGSTADLANSVHQTGDGGFILSGYTTSFGAGSYDVYLVKTNSSGDTLWTRTYGGSGGDYGGAVQPTSDGGYIVAGWTDSFGAGLTDIYLVKTNASGDTLWTRTYGGGNSDDAYSIQQVDDGGYILAGYTNSIGAGDADMYLVRTDANGDTLWTRTFGGGGNDLAYFVQQSRDGGFVVAGRTNTFGAGSFDSYLVKVSASGNTQWTRTFGGGLWDEAFFIQQTRDDGYILTGQTHSFGSGSSDVFLLKTDADGNEEWTRYYGGGNADLGLAVEQINDGSFILAGATHSFGVGGNFDMWLLKTGPENPPALPTPDVLWSQTFGGLGTEIGYAMDATFDGGFVMAGYEDSFGGGGPADFWIVKTDTNGDGVWSRSFGGSVDDRCYAVKQTIEGGYILAGYTYSFGSGFADFWLVKTDANGDSLWSRAYGTSSYENCYAVEQTSDDGYILAGTNNIGFWIVKTNTDGDSLWSQTYDRDYEQVCRFAHQTSDGGYILAGDTGGPFVPQHDFWLLKVDSVGSIEWSRDYGGFAEDYFYAAQQTDDGGFVMTGKTYSFGAAAYDVFVVRTDSVGDTLWTRRFGGDSDDIGFSVKQTPNGEFAVAGQSASFGGGVQFWLLKIGVDGDSLWSRTFGGGSEDICYAIHSNPDGSYTLGGYTASFGNSAEFWLVRTEIEPSPFVVHWTNPAGGSWFDWNNWDPAQIPGASDTVFITLPGDYTVTVPADAEVSRLILGSGIPGDTTTQTLAVNCPSCQLSIFGNSVVRETGVLSASSGATVALTSPNITLTDSGQVSLAGSATFSIGSLNTLDLTGGNLNLTGNTNLTNGGNVQNAGQISRSGTGISSIAANYRETGLAFDSSLLVTSGTLAINSPDSAVIRSIVHIDSIAELSVQRAQVKSTAMLSGDGAFTLSGGNADIAGDFLFFGTLEIAGGNVNFHPLSGALLDTFRILSGATFTSAVSLTSEIIRMHGGTTSANITVNNRYDWTAGTLTGAPASALTIGNAVILSLTGPGAKALDTRDLVIDGTASMSGAGVFSLLNGASITVSGDGSLALGDSLTISGPADTLFNNGILTINAPTDTCVLNIALWNSPVGRTPGTIDILGMTRVWQVDNLGTIALQNQSRMNIMGRYRNSSLSDLGNGTITVAHDSLINLPTGILRLTGDAQITGNGGLHNSGNITRLSGALRTPSTCSISAEFHNLVGGRVAIEADTLALTNPVADNADTIVVFAEAALNTTTSFTNLPGGVIIGGGVINITINTLVAKIQGHDVRLSWTPIPGAIRYDVYRATQPYDNIAQYTLIGIVLEGGTQFVHVNGANLNRAFYRVVPRDTLPTVRAPKSRPAR